MRRCWIELAFTSQLVDHGGRFALDIKDQVAVPIGGGVGHRDALVPAEEEVVPPRVVAVVLEVRREQRVEVAPRLERLAHEPEPRLLERLAALAVVAGLAGGDQVLPAVAAPAMARHHVVEGEVLQEGDLIATVVAG